MPGFLDDLRAALKDGSFRPLPVRERKIPKPGGSGKVRNLGIPTVADRVVQAALKLVLEPIFEADFVPVSYGFRPKRRAHDAIAEIHHFGTRGYRWVLDADIEAAFDIHLALRPDGSGAGAGQGQARAWRWSRRSSKPGCSPNSASTAGHLHRHTAGRHPVPADLQHRAVRARRARDGAMEARRDDVDRGQARLPALQGTADVADHPLRRRFCDLGARFA